jgi:hypothetical protein
MALLIKKYHKFRINICTKELAVNEYLILLADESVACEGGYRQARSRAGGNGPRRVPPRLRFGIRFTGSC